MLFSAGREPAIRSHSSRRARAVALAALLALTAAGLGGSSTAAQARTAPDETAASVVRHGTGLRIDPTQATIQPSTVHTRSALQATGATGIRAASALPATVDLSADAPTAGDQSYLNSCVGWATGYTLMGWEAAHAVHAGAPFAPMYVYSQIHFEDVNGADIGSNSIDAFTVLKAQGVAERSNYSHGDYDYTHQPTAAEKLDASANKISSYSYLFKDTDSNNWKGAGSAGVTALKTALAAGKPVAIGIGVYNDFYGLDATDDVAKDHAWGASGLQAFHEIVAFGYDSTGLRVENSWGTSWGQEGWATLPWSFVKHQVFEAAVVGGFKKITAAPKVTSLSPDGVAPAGGTKVTVRADNVAEMDPSAAGAVKLVRVSDGSTHAVTVKKHGSRAIVFTTPALAAGEYRVVITNSHGAGTDTAASHLWSSTTPAAVIAAHTKALSTGGTRVTLTGKGFGADAAAFAAKKITVTVAGVAQDLTWVSSTSLSVTVPAGKPGVSPAVTLHRGGLPGASSSSVTYAADLTKVAPRSVRHSGGVTVTLTGKGLSKATSWKIVTAGGTKTSLKVYSSKAKLAKARSGVWIASGTRALVKLPKAPHGSGWYTFKFTAKGAPFLATSAGRVKYKA